MFSVVSGATLLLSPVAAGLAAWLVHTQVTDELLLVAKGTRRGSTTLCSVAVTVWVGAVLAMGAGLTVGSLVCVIMGASADNVTLPWQALTGFAAVGAAAFLGTVVGAVSKSHWSVPSVALGILFAHRPWYVMGYPELVTTEMATVETPGMRPIASHLRDTVACNLVLVLGLSCVLLWIAGTSRGRWWAWVGFAVAMGVMAAIFVPYVVEGRLNTYEPLP